LKFNNVFLNKLAKSKNNFKRARVCNYYKSRYHKLKYCSNFLCCWWKRKRWCTY